MPVVVLIFATVAAAVDWWAVATDRRRVELVAKPATMALLVALAASLGDAPGDVRGWLVLGAVLGLLGDVALLGTDDVAFLAGLGAFAAGHLAYAAAALLVDFEPGWLLPAVVFLVVLLGYRFAGETLPGARRHGGPVLAGAVVFYAVVISIMVAAAWASASWPAAVGAMLFAVSDWALGYQRFVRPFAQHGRLAVIVPYHVGQAALIVGLATA